MDNWASVCLLGERRLGPQLDHHLTRHPYVGSERRRRERTSLKLVGRVLVDEALSVELFRRPRRWRVFPDDLSSVPANVLIQPNWQGVKTRTDGRSLL